MLLSISIVTAINNEKNNERRETNSPLYNIRKNGAIEGEKESRQKIKTYFVERLFFMPLQEIQDYSINSQVEWKGRCQARTSGRIYSNRPWCKVSFTIPTCSFTCPYNCP